MENIGLSEFDLISRFMDRSGYRVKAINYFRDMIWTNIGGTFYFGGRDGYIPEHSFFYGNVNIWTEIYTLADLVHKNMLRMNFATLLFNGIETTDLDIVLGVNLGLSLMGDGTYSGNKRLYGCGFNKINFSVGDLDAAATWNTEVCLNGFMFSII